jgi:hypothetical protein
MSIQDLGSLGELIAAVATLFTLGYLGYQIRQNTAELRNAAFRDVFQGYSNIRRSIYADKDLSDLVVRARRSCELSEEEIYRYENLLSEWLFSSLQYFRFVQTGRLPSQSWFITRNRIVMLLDNPIGRRWWQETKPAFDSALVTEIDVALAGPGNSRQPLEPDTTSETAHHR